MSEVNYPNPAPAEPQAVVYGYGDRNPDFSRASVQLYGVKEKKPRSSACVCMFSCLGIFLIIGCIFSVAMIAVAVRCQYPMERVLDPIDVAPTVTSLDIKVNWGELKVVENNTLVQPMILLTAKAASNTAVEKIRVKPVVSGGVLSLDITGISGNPFDCARVDVTIQLPHVLTTLTEIKLHNEAGQIEFDDVTTHIRKVEMGVEAGRIKVDTMLVGQLTVESEAGHVDIGRVELVEFPTSIAKAKFSCEVGHVEVDELVVSPALAASLVQIDFTTEAGHIDVERVRGFKGKFVFTTEAGHIEVEGYTKMDVDKSTVKKGTVGVGLMEFNVATEVGHVEVMFA